MSVDLQKKPDYDKIIDALVEKTKQGKLRWQDTAEESTYLAAVKGQRTFEISCDSDASPPQIRLVIRDVDGKAFLDIGSPYHSPTGLATSKLKELYELAGRIALNLDEKADETVQLLDQL